LGPGALDFADGGKKGGQRQKAQRGENTQIQPASNAKKTAGEHLRRELSRNRETYMYSVGHRRDERRPLVTTRGVRKKLLRREKNRQRQGKGKEG